MYSIYQIQCRGESSLVHVQKQTTPAMQTPTLHHQTIHNFLNDKMTTHAKFSIYLGISSSNPFAIDNIDTHLNLDLDEYQFDEAAVALVVSFGVYE